MAKMKAQTLVDKAVDIAKNYKTLYVMGCFGAPLTGANVTRYRQRLHRVRLGGCFGHLRGELCGNRQGLQS